MISDTLALAPYGELARHVGSISGYGWAARFLALYVGERGVLTLEEGIRRMSSLTAERLGLRDRGRLQPGLPADITIFDRERIESRCTIEQPREYATGIVHVLVNGPLAIRNGQRTDDGSEVLRP